MERGRHDMFSGDLSEADAEKLSAKVAGHPQTARIMGGNGTGTPGAAAEIG